MLSAMSEVFERDSRFSLVATSATAEGLLGMIIRVPVQICIIDWNIPVLGGEKLIEVLHAQANEHRPIVYGDSTDLTISKQAMIAGAAAFVSKSAPIEELIQTCLDVADGKMVFPYLDIKELKTDPIATLSKKEKALLDALAEGLTNKQLAIRFEITTNTVKFHLSNIFDKLSVRNRAQAIAHYYASKMKIKYN